jgi:hypothetical protein
MKPSAEGIAQFRLTLYRMNTARNEPGAGPVESGLWSAAALLPLFLTNSHNSIFGEVE